MEIKQVLKETQDHIDKVSYFIEIIISELRFRSVYHDKSKFSEEELPLFVEFTDKLKDLTYGTDEYTKSLESLKPALEHHYANNKHHPEHYLNGIEDMDLIDLIEMFCDWNAATRRHKDGNINKSIEFNKDRFKMSEQLVHIFKNSIKYFDSK